MRTNGIVRDDRGFTLAELLVASTITLIVLAVGMASFMESQQLQESVAQLSDSNHNLRAGSNMLVRDLMQAGRNIPTGGIPLPAGTGVTATVRPGPPNQTSSFTGDTLTAITTGAGRGLTIGGRATDLVTFLMQDTLLPDLNLYQTNAPTDRARFLSGTTVNVGSDTTWLTGDSANGIAPVKVGDLMYFQNSKGKALQTVTAVSGSTMSFATGDPFNFNQPSATSGSITQILPTSPAPAWKTTNGPVMTVRRVTMLTYFVAQESGNVPRLMRAFNHGPAQALAGVIESLEFSYDLVSGTGTNPTDVKSLLVTLDGVTYSANQIRRVNVKVGVRSEMKLSRTGDYLRNRVSTVVDLRNLAYVDRYDTQ